MATPHIEAKLGEIADIVIMSGDPLRAKFIAEEYLDDYKLVNQIRAMYAYTGYYKGKRVTVMGHGMGMAGAGIYFYELFKFYNVNTIIRIGSCGTSLPEVRLLDTILVDQVYTESTYAYVFNKELVSIGKPNVELTEKLYKIANDKNIKLLRGTAMSCDVFDPYIDWGAMMERVPSNLDILGVEMECFALFYIAKILNKKAACLLTVVDSKCVDNIVSREDRQKSLINMIEIALEGIL